MHKYSILISIFIIFIPVISFGAEDCSKYTNEINEYVNTISGLKREQITLTTTLNDGFKALKASYSDMSLNSVYTLYKTRFSIELGRYDNIPSIINGIIDNIDFSQKMYTYCTNNNYLEEVNNYNQSQARQAQDAENLKRTQEIEAIFAQKAKEDSIKLQAQNEQEKKDKQGENIKSAKLAKIEANKLKIMELKKKRGTIKKK